MRRSDREVTGIDNIIAIMRKCDVCRIALNNNGFPYILPLNFGFDIADSRISLYFHGAMAGTKYELIARDNRASFEMDCGHELLTDIKHKNCTMAYESVMGQGRITLLPEEEKSRALGILMRHYHQESFPLNQNMLPHTNVFMLVAEHVTAKRRMRTK